MARYPTPQPPFLIFFYILNYLEERPAINEATLRRLPCPVINRPGVAGAVL